MARILHHEHDVVVQYSHEHDVVYSSIQYSHEHDKCSQGNVYDLHYNEHLQHLMF